MDLEHNFLKFSGHFARTVGAFVSLTSAVILTFTFVFPSLAIFTAGAMNGNGITGMIIYDVSPSLSLSVSQTYAASSVMFIWLVIGFCLLIIGNNLIPARKY